MSLKESKLQAIVDFRGPFSRGVCSTDEKFYFLAIVEGQTIISWHRFRSGPPFKIRQRSSEEKQLLGLAFFAQFL